VDVSTLFTYFLLRRKESPVAGSGELNPRRPLSFTTRDSECLALPLSQTARLPQLRLQHLIIIFTSAPSCLSSALLPSSFIIIYLLAPEEEFSVESTCVSFVFRRIGEYISLDLFYHSIFYIFFFNTT